MIMISLGSCFFTMISMFLGGESRIAANIVTGIGFLGAGVIFRSEGRINGITTAATIWAVAAVGMGIGAGHYLASGIASLFIVIVLAVLPYAENAIEEFNKSLTYNITTTFTVGTKSEYEKLFREHHIKPRLLKETKEGNELVLSFDAVGRLKHHELLVSRLQADPAIRKIERYRRKPRAVTPFIPEYSIFKP